MRTPSCATKTPPRRGQELVTLGIFTNSDPAFERSGGEKDEEEKIEKK